MSSIIRKKYVFILAIAIFFPFYCLAQEPKNAAIIYHVQHVYEKSSISQQLMRDFKEDSENWGKKEEIISLFKPVKGVNKVILFVGAYEALSAHEKKEEIFHDLLIVELDDQKTVINGIHYTLEWAEQPLAYDVYFLKSTKMKLRSYMDIESFQFESILDGDQKPKGKLDNIYLFGEISAN